MPVLLVERLHFQCKAPVTSHFGFDSINLKYVFFFVLAFILSIYACKLATVCLLYEKYLFIFFVLKVLLLSCYYLNSFYVLCISPLASMVVNLLFIL